MIKKLLAIGILLIAGTVLLLYLVQELDPTTQTWRQYQLQQNIAQSTQLAPIVFLAKAAVVISIATSISLTAMIMTGISIWWLLRRVRIAPHLVYPNRAGLMPAIVVHPANGYAALPANEHGAQIMAASVAGRGRGRMTAAQIRAARQDWERSDVPALPEPEPEPMRPLDAEGAIEVDPRRYPHTILIGETGAGKSRATFLLLSALCRSHHCEVMILEREAIDWNDACAVSTPAGYLDALKAVEVERQRRAGLLRAADVQHISELPSPPPYLVVVVEEAESVYSYFSLDNRERAREYAVTLRDLAQLGRKAGILLLVTTQTGTSGVFDIPTRKQFGTRLFFRSEPQVGDSWGIPRDFRLSELPTGTAYSMRHNGLVEFPLLARPQLPLSTLFTEQKAPLQLPIDAEADGLGENDMPDGVTVQEPVYREETPQNRSSEGKNSGIPVSVPQDVPPSEEAIKRLIWQTWRRTRSLKATERELYDQDGGIKFYWVRDAVAEMEARRGRKLQEVL